MKPFFTPINLHPLQPLRLTPLVLGAALMLLSGCASLMSPLQFLQGRSQMKVLVSEQAPYPEYQCKSLGFLPCTLGDTQGSTPPKGQEYLQCARNLLSYVEKTGTNYLHIAAPLNVLGINWRDSKANLYDCQYLPQPSRQNEEIRRTAPTTPTPAAISNPVNASPSTLSPDNDASTEPSKKRTLPLSKR